MIDDSAVARHLPGEALLALLRRRYGRAKGNSARLVELGFSVSAARRVVRDGTRGVELLLICALLDATPDDARDALLGELEVQQAAEVARALRRQSPGYEIAFQALWWIDMVGGYVNSARLADALGVSLRRARDLRWCRADFTADELDRLATMLEVGVGDLLMPPGQERFDRVDWIRAERGKL